MKLKVIYNLTLSFIISVLFLSCSETIKDTRHILEGRITNAPELILLQRLDSIPVTVDTINVSAEGTFVCNSKSLQSDFYWLAMGEKKINLILQSDSTTVIDVDYSKINETLRFTKFNQSAILLQLEEISHQFDVVLRAKQDSIKSLVGTAVNDSIIRLKYYEIDSIRTIYRSQLDTLLNHNRSKLVTIPILLQQSGNTALYTLPRDKELFMSTQYLLSQNYSSSYQVKKFSSQILKVFSKTDGIAKIEIGSKLPDLELFTPWNERLPLSNLLGKYVLVVVWKSDNEICRTRNKLLTKMIWRYRSHGLETYMISLDTDSKQWQKVTEEDELNCFHVTDLLGESSPVIANLGVTKLPTLYLLNKEGKVVEKDIWGAKLEDALATLVKK